LKRFLILAGIVLACAAAFQLYKVQEGFELDKFSGMMVFYQDNCAACDAMNHAVKQLKSKYPDNVLIFNGSKKGETTQAMIKKYEVTSYPSRRLVVKGNRIDDTLANSLNPETRQLMKRTDYDSLEKQLKKASLLK
jgi:thiol-disulfide isomerase/thioredoxin